MKFGMDLDPEHRLKLWSPGEDGEIAAGDGGDLVMSQL